MKLNSALVAVSLATFPLAVSAAEGLDDALRAQAAQYRERQAKAAEALNDTRERIAREKAPLLQSLRAAEERVIRAEAEQRRGQIAQEHAAEIRRNLVKELDDRSKTANYVTTLVHEGLKTLKDGAAPAESQLIGTRVDELLQAIDRATTANRGQTALAATEYMLQHLERAVGGYTATGSSLVAADNQLRSGTFAFVGPETFFRSDDGAHFGTVRLREGSNYPTTHPIKNWPAADAHALFTRNAGTIAADASAGKALRLAETKGTVWEHIEKGGVVALAILVAGAVALLLIVQKIRDLFGMGVDSPVLVQECLVAIADRNFAEADKTVSRLRGCTRELFSAGLAQRDLPKNQLEANLESVLMEQRLHHERRLPLLAVIATAAPLMGLLGTVVGMVRTFALITVFGTGNAGKLSSGISEVLVATELGLMVAIPSLVAHGFLAHRIQKNLATLERYALQFVTAVEEAKSRDGRVSGGVLVT